MSQARIRLNQVAARKESTVVQHLVACCWVLPNGTPTRREPYWLTCRCAKPKGTSGLQSYCLIKYMCTPYTHGIQLFMGLGDSPPLSISNKCKTKPTRRHREGAHKQVQGTRAQGTRASTTRARRHAVSAKTNRLANAQTRARYAQAGEKYAHTGRAPDVSLSLSLA